MRLQFISFLIGLLAALAAFAQKDEPVVLKTDKGEIEGTILLPEAKLPVPVALIIAGSGPTDRNGNNPVMTNNSLKMLAEELAKNGIASLRYDKRGIAKSKAAGLNEADLRFENYIQDVTGWVGYLKERKQFTSIVLIGHSEGSLIGMVSAQTCGADKFVSLSGAGQSADKIIRDQLKAQPPFVLEQASPVLDELVKGKTVENVPQMLYALFRPSVQPYLISWLKYNPQVEIARLKIPLLIVQGTTDIQVSVNDAQLLHSAKPDSKLLIVDGMNHILKNAEADRLKNVQTYNQPDLPVNAELIKAVVTFIKSN